jgi:hypothetical protein
MATIEISDKQLTVSVHGVDRILVLASKLTVPLEHVASARSGEPEAREWFKGIRFGTNVPGLVTAGAFYKHGEWVFWDVHDPALAVAIELHDEHYRRLIVQTDDPAASIAAIQAAVAKAP